MPWKIVLFEIVSATWLFAEDYAKNHSNTRSEKYK
jgi:hypothetical protein